MEQSNSQEAAEIREKLWKGQIFVKIEVPEQYISGSDFPKPIYVLISIFYYSQKTISRNSYLDFQNDVVNEVFKSCVISSELWFGLKERPLHWYFFAQ